MGYSYSVPVKNPHYRVLTVLCAMGGKRKLGVLAEFFQGHLGPLLHRAWVAGDLGSSSMKKRYRDTPEFNRHSELSLLLN